MGMQEIIKEVAKRKIPAEVGYDEESDSLVYMVSGFSKSGTATLKQVGADIIAYTRYGREDVVETFEDLARVAFSWYINWRDRESYANPSSYWADVFMGYGWLQKKTETVTTYF